MELPTAASACHGVWKKQVKRETLTHSGCSSSIFCATPAILVWKHFSVETDCNVSLTCSTEHHACQDEFCHAGVIWVTEDFHFPQNKNDAQLWRFEVFTEQLLTRLRGYHILLLKRFWLQPAWRRKINRKYFFLCVADGTGKKPFDNCRFIDWRRIKFFRWFPKLKVKLKKKIHSRKLRLKLRQWQTKNSQQKKKH